VVHPLNPPYLVPAVEVVPATWTSTETVARVQALLVRAGHEPIMLKKEIDGFVVNRLQGALLQEAFRLVAEGYADPRDVDRAVAKGLGLRWSFIGPFEVAETNAPGGIKDYIAKYEALFKRLWSSYTVPWQPLANALEAEYDKQTPRGKLRERQLWRDRRLIALAAQKRDAAKTIGD
jgi:3-hydroxyacyl-CoA dehydrogenase